MPDEVTPAEPTPVVPATPAAPELTGPWANDLKEAFGDDPELLTKVNGFMADKYQPYVTKIEQDSAPARALFKDLSENFDGTMAALLSEVYGDDRPDLADRFTELLAAGATPAEAGAQVAAEGQVKSPEALPAEVQEIVEERKLAKQQEAYQTALAALKAEVKDEAFDDDEFGPFVVSADGNLANAYAMYSTWRAKVQAKYGPAAVETPPVAAPPSPIGTDATSAGTSTPPVQKKYASIDDAIDDFMADARAQRSAPTTVGTV